MSQSRNRRSARTRPPRPANDVVTNNAQENHGSKNTNKIPKNVRYDLENALLGLCDVWFEDIKPHLVKNNLKLHTGGALNDNYDLGTPRSPAGDYQRDRRDPRDRRVDPGAAPDCRRRAPANSSGSSPTRPAASRAPYPRPPRSRPTPASPAELINSLQLPDEWTRPSVRRASPQRPSPPLTRPCHLNIHNSLKQLPDDKWRPPKKEPVPRRSPFTTPTYQQSSTKRVQFEPYEWTRPRLRRLSPPVTRTFQRTLPSSPKQAQLPNYDCMRPPIRRTTEAKPPLSLNTQNCECSAKQGKKSRKKAKTRRMSQSRSLSPPPRPLSTRIADQCYACGLMTPLANVANSCTFHQSDKIPVSRYRISRVQSNAPYIESKRIPQKDACNQTSRIDVTKKHPLRKRVPDAKIPSRNVRIPTNDHAPYVAPCNRKISPSPHHATSFSPTPVPATDFSPTPLRATSISRSQHHATSFSPTPLRAASISPPPDHATGFSPTPLRTTRISQSRHHATSLSPTTLRAASISPPPHHATGFSPTRHRAATISLSPHYATTFSPTPVPATGFSPTSLRATNISQCRRRYTTTFSPTPLRSTSISQSRHHATNISHPPHHATSFSPTPIRATSFSPTQLRAGSISPSPLRTATDAPAQHTVTKPRRNQRPISLSPPPRPSPNETWVRQKSLLEEFRITRPQEHIRIPIDKNSVPDYNLRTVPSRHAIFPHKHENEWLYEDEAVLFSKDLIDIIGDKNDKRLRVLYKNPASDLAHSSIMCLAGSQNTRKKTTPKKMPWR